MRDASWEKNVKRNEFMVFSSTTKNDGTKRRLVAASRQQRFFPPKVLALVLSLSQPALPVSSLGQAPGATSNEPHETACLSQTTHPEDL